jgi:hypothetical protein
MALSFSDFCATGECLPLPLPESDDAVGNCCLITTSCEAATFHNLIAGWISKLPFSKNVFVFGYIVCMQGIHPRDIDVLAGGKSFVPQRATIAVRNNKVNHFPLCPSI